MQNVLTSTRRPIAEHAAAVDAALQLLVAMEGGWQERAPVRRRAFDSDEVRRLKKAVALLFRLAAALRRHRSIGAWDSPLIRLAQQVAALDLGVSATDTHTLLEQAVGAITAQKEDLHKAKLVMVRERHKR